MCDSGLHVHNRLSEGLKDADVRLHRTRNQLELNVSRR